MAEKSVKSSCTISRSLSCRWPVVVRPMVRTCSMSWSSRHSRKTPWPTIPVAPKRMTFIRRALRTRTLESTRVGDRGERSPPSGHVYVHVHVHVHVYGGSSLGDRDCRVGEEAERLDAVHADEDRHHRGHDPVDPARLGGLLE